MEKYKAKYDADANIQAAYGYRAMSLFAVAAEQAGHHIDSAKLTAALESITGYTDMFGGPALSFSSTSHVGTTQGGLAQIDGTRWVTLIDILE
jgi:ABC-type branched-subunit amino acid transport system substrate-binding protein